MWYKVVLLLYVFSGMRLEFVSGANGYNEEVKNLLCEVFAVSKGILKIYGENKLLNESIYGSKTHNALIKENGNVIRGFSCKAGLNGRPVLCSHTGVGDGCYAQSLLGTFLCVCTPGNSGGDNSLCGVNIAEYSGMSWSGSWMGSGGNTVLFKNVLQKVVEKCVFRRESEKKYTEELKRLEDKVNSIMRILEAGKDGWSSYFYLGGSGKSNCNGMSDNELCVAYKGNGKSKDKVNIPWIIKIKMALEELKKSTPRKSEVALRSTRGKAGKSVQPGPGGAAEKSTKNADTAVQNKAVSEESNDQPENREHKIQATGSPAVPTNAQATEKSTSLNSTMTDIPYLSQSINDDGSILTNPKWVLLSALLL